MKIKLIVVGNLKEKYWKDAQNEYLKRISKYAKVELIELKDLPIKGNCSDKDLEQVKVNEGQRILQKIKPQDFVVLLDLNGPQYTSPEMASQLDKWFVSGGSNITFVIGGSLGLSEEVKKRGNATITLGKITLPHQLCRIVLLEQIYRCFKINNNETYHK